MYNVKRKWALITGAARRIGYLTALFMADQGCNLILHSRDLSHTEKVLSEVRSKGVSAFSVAADLNDPAAVAKMLTVIDEACVDVDIVLNNAGLQIAYRTDWCETPVSDYEVSFRVNRARDDLLSLPAEDDRPRHRTDPEHHQRHRPGRMPGGLLRQQSRPG